MSSASRPPASRPHLTHLPPESGGRRGLPRPADRRPRAHQHHAGHLAEVLVLLPLRRGQFVRRRGAQRCVRRHEVSPGAVWPLARHDAPSGPGRAGGDRANRGQSAIATVVAAGRRRRQEITTSGVRKRPDGEGQGRGSFPSARCRFRGRENGASIAQPFERGLPLGPDRRPRPPPGIGRAPVGAGRASGRRTCPRTTCKGTCRPGGRGAAERSSPTSRRPTARPTHHRPPRCLPTPAACSPRAPGSAGEPTAGAARRGPCRPPRTAGPPAGSSSPSASGVGTGSPPVRERPGPGRGRPVRADRGGPVPAPAGGGRQPVSTTGRRRTRRCTGHGPRNRLGWAAVAARRVPVTLAFGVGSPEPGPWVPGQIPLLWPRGG
jgi:hypothetical protein